MNQDRLGKSGRSVGLLVSVAAALGACNLVADLEEPGRLGAGGTTSKTSAGGGTNDASGTETGGRGGAGGEGGSTDVTTADVSSSSGSGCPPPLTPGSGSEQILDGSFEMGGLAGWIVSATFNSSAMIANDASYCGCTSVSFQSPADDGYGEFRYDLGQAPAGRYRMRAAIGAPDGLEMNVILRTPEGVEVGLPVFFLDDAIDGSVDGVRHVETPPWNVPSFHEQLLAIVAISNPNDVPLQPIHLDCVSLEYTP